MKMPWNATHQNGDPALWKEVERRAQPLMAIAQQRDWDTAFEQLWRRHVTGPVVTKEGIESFSRALAELIVSRIYPNVDVTTLWVLEAQLQSLASHQIQCNDLSMSTGTKTRLRLSYTGLLSYLPKHSENLFPSFVHPFSRPQIIDTVEMLSVS